MISPPPNDSGLGALSVRGKGNKARTLPISSEAYDAISTYIADRTEGSLFLTLDGKRTINQGYTGSFLKVGYTSRLTRRQT